MSETKKCQRCQKLLPLINFGKFKRSLDGYRHVCKPCRNIMDKIRKEKGPANNYDKKNFQKCWRCQKIKSLDKFHKGVSTNGHSYGCIKCNKILRKQWVKNNPERVKELYKKNDLKKNRYRAWATNTLSKHRKRGVICGINTDELQELATNSKYCNFCNCELCWEKTKTGGHQPNSPTLENLMCENYIEKKDTIIICMKCNTSKSNRTLDEYIEYIENILPELKKIQESKQESLISSVLKSDIVQDSREANQRSSPRLEA